VLQKDLVGRLWQVTPKETTAGWFSDMPEGLFEKLQQMRQTKIEAA